MKLKHFLTALLLVLAPLAIFSGCVKSNPPVGPASVSNVTITVPARDAHGKLLGAAQNTFLYYFSGAGAPVTGSVGPITIPSGASNFSFQVAVNTSSYNFVGLQLNDGTTNQTLAIGATSFSASGVPVTLGPVNKSVYQVNPLGAGQAYGFEANSQVNVGANTATNAPGIDVECNITSDSSGFELDNAALANSTIAYLGNGNFVNYLQLPATANFKVSSTASKSFVMTGNTSTIKPLTPGDVYCVKMSTGYAWLQIVSVSVAGPVFQFRVNTTLPYCGYEQSTADAAAIAAANATATPTATPNGAVVTAVYSVTGAGNPYDVAVMGPANGPATTVFVPGSTSGKVYAFDVSGGVSYGFTGTGVVAPTGMAIDSSSTYLYVADPTGWMVNQFKINIGYANFAGSSWQGCIGNGVVVTPPDNSTQAGTGAMAKPRYVSLDASGNLFATDTGTSGFADIMEYFGPVIPLGNTTAVTYWTGPLSNSTAANCVGETATSGTTVIVADSANNRISFCAAANGSLVAPALTSDNNTGNIVNFINPQGVAYSSSTGLLYIADTGNNRIVEMTFSGTFVKVLGPTLSGSYGSLNGPTGIKLDNATPPNIYVADTGNGRIIETK